MAAKRDGRLKFCLSSTDSDWWCNDRDYSFRPGRTDQLVVRATKSRTRLLTVDFVGPLNRWMKLSGKLPNCPRGEAIVTIKWSERNVTLEVNNEVLFTGDPTMSIPIAASGIEALVNILGAQWVEQELESGAQADTAAHSFVNFYRQYRDLDEPSRASSLAAPVYNAIGESIAVAAAFPGFSEVLPRLRDPSSFRDAVAECLAAGVLARLSGTIEFNKPSGAPGVRTPDLTWFLPRSGMTHGVPAEVKRVRSYNSKRTDLEAKHWEPLRERILSLQHAMRVDLDVYALFKDEPTEKGKKELLSAIRAETALAYWRCLRSTETVEVWARLAPRGAIPNYDLVLPPVADHDTASIAVRSWASSPTTTVSAPPVAGTAEWSLLIGPADANAVMLDPSVIALDVDHPRMRIENFVGAFKSAVGQLPRAGPGVVVIEIPHSTPEQRALYTEWLTKEFARRKHTRVNRVYLMWLDDTPERYEIAGAVYVSPRCAGVLDYVNNENCRSPTELPEVNLPTFAGTLAQRIEVVAGTPRT